MTDSNKKIDALLIWLIICANEVNSMQRSSNHCMRVSIWSLQKGRSWPQSMKVTWLSWTSKSLNWTLWTKSRQSKSQNCMSNCIRLKYLMKKDSSSGNPNTEGNAKTDSSSENRSVSSGTRWMNNWKINSVSSRTRQGDWSVRDKSYKSKRLEQSIHLNRRKKTSQDWTGTLSSWTTIWRASSRKTSSPPWTRTVSEGR